MTCNIFVCRIFYSISLGNLCYNVSFKAFLSLCEFAKELAGIFSLTDRIFTQSVNK